MADEGRSRLGDFTRPIPVDKRIVRRPRLAAFTGLLALVVMAAVAFAVFVLPIGTWRDQSTDIEQRRIQLDELQRVNSELAEETTRLESPDGVREAAREDYGFVEVGEKRSTILPMPPLPTDLPDGWPYNAVSEIMDARTAGPAIPDPTDTAAAD